MNVEKIRTFVEDLFDELGLSEENAKTSADVILQAELTGVLTHGLAKLPQYVARYKRGAGNNDPELKLINEHGINRLYDGDNGSGLIVGPKALEQCIKQTKKHGIAAVAVRHSGHFGCGNYYAWKFAENNLIGIIMTNTLPLMAPYGGKQREIGTNPVIFSIPAREEFPIVLDMATSLATFGKLQIASVAKEKVPTTWAKNKHGLPTDDPDEGLAGTLQPLADHKGYGLAVIVDALTSLLAFGKFGRNIPSFEELMKNAHEDISHFFLGIDPASFYPLDQFLDYVDSYVVYMKNSPKAKGVEEIFLPGEIEFRKYQAAMENSITLSEEQDKRLLGIVEAIGEDTTGFAGLSQWIEEHY